eukprot:2626304-Rhodomonas_salina.3
MSGTDLARGPSTSSPTIRSAGTTSHLTVAHSARYLAENTSAFPELRYLPIHTLGYARQQYRQNSIPRINIEVLWETDIPNRVVLPCATRYAMSGTVVGYAALRSTPVLCHVRRGYHGREGNATVGSVCNVAAWYSRRRSACANVLIWALKSGCNARALIRAWVFQVTTVDDGKLHLISNVFNVASSFNELQVPTAAKPTVIRVGLAEYGLEWVYCYGLVNPNTG